MVNLRGVAAALALLAGCTAGPSPAAPEQASSRHLRADRISFEINSWGSPMESFRIAADGTGEYGKAPAFRAPLQTHRFNAGRAGFARIRAALASIEQFTARPPVCGSRATDLPYGEIVWQHGTVRASVRFDVGCRGEEMQRVVNAAHAAARLAEQFSRAGAGH